MKFIRNITLIGIMVFLSSCSVSGPMTSPKALVTKNPVGSKVGIAELTVYPFGIYFGDADLGIVAAAKKGKITKIATVDSEIVSGFFTTKLRTIVTGTNDEPEPEEKKGKKRRRKKSRR